MAKTIEIDDLADIIARELSQYNDSINAVMDEENLKLAKQLTADLKNDSSIPKSKAENKHYRDSFYMKKYGTKSKKRGYVIANKKYQLTHLLEKGHDYVGRDGIRKLGAARAFPHWEQANKKVQDLAIIIRKRLEDGLK